MPIETLEDWNQILGQCCCEMPGCPIPDTECQSVLGDFRLVGYTDDTSEGWSYDPQYQITILTYSGENPQTVTYTRDTVLFMNIGSVDFSAGNGTVTVEYGSGSDYDSPITETFQNPTTEAQALSQARAVFGANKDFDDPDQNITAACVASFSFWAPSSSTSYRGFLRYVRYRWVIPSTWSDQNTGQEVPFTGTYFKVTWDVVTYPYDPEAELSYVQDLTWEWTGPGDPENEDSWKSGWYDLDPPGDPGEKKVVNVRFECYRPSNFGHKPQITGGSEDITDDVPLQNRFTSPNHSINLLRT